MDPWIHGSVAGAAAASDSAACNYSLPFNISREMAVTLPLDAPLDVTRAGPGQ